MLSEGQRKWIFLRLFSSSTHQASQQLLLFCFIDSATSRAISVLLMAMTCVRVLPGEHAAYVSVFSLDEFLLQKKNIFSSQKKFLEHRDTKQNRKVRRKRESKNQTKLQMRKKVFLVSVFESGK
jgi:hypothetical protein